jgi:hypothetical protein
VVGLAQVADVAVFDAEACDPRFVFCFGHAVPLGIDINTHTIVDDES